MQQETAREGLAKSVTLIIGGVRSGKSGYAQRLAEQSESVTFIATAEVRDDAEMRVKIDRHRADRPGHWTTVEEPLDLAGALGRVPAGETVLIDCLTLYASNLLEAGGAEAAVDRFCAALQAAAGEVMIVSNEVGSGVVPAYELGRRFRDLVGEINQQVAGVADNVLYMVAGLPMCLKGFIPGGTR